MVYVATTRKDMRTNHSGNYSVRGKSVLYAGGGNGYYCRISSGWDHCSILAAHGNSALDRCSALCL